MAFPMKMQKSRFVSFALALGFTCLLVLSGAGVGAGTETRVPTETKKTSYDINLLKGDYHAYLIHMRPVDKLTATIKVGLGDEVDVYTMSAADYEYYKGTTAVQFGYEQGFSKEHMKYLEFSSKFSPGAEGDIVIVVDNVAKTQSGATGTTDVLCTITVDVYIEPPFPWWAVGVVVTVVVALVCFFLFMMWQKKKKAELEEAEKQKKRMEAAKTRPIFLPPPPPGFSGPAPIPTMGSTSAGTATGAPPPSSSCKSCPHIYDATSANCIACEYR
jgi:hypothetical protein